MSVPIAIGVIGVDGVTALDLTGPLEAFAAAQIVGAGEQTASGYEVVVIGITGKTFVAESGIIFKPQKTLATAPPLHTVIIPGGLGIRSGKSAAAVTEWLRARGDSIQRIVSISTGIFAVAPTGLLDGREVTTHWRFASALARQCPASRINSTAAFVKDGPIYSCGAGTAAIEMTLSLIEEDYGAQVALSVAREFVMELKSWKQGAEDGESFDYQVAPSDRLADLPAWIVAHLRNDLSVDALAERIGLCPRHFSRLFKDLFKTTPADFVEQLRLGEGRRRLLLPRNSIESIASSVGFKSADAFRRAFERRFGMTPREFRGQTQTRRKIAAYAA